MRCFQVFVGILFILGVGGSAEAQVTRLLGNSFESGVVPNTITNDLSISFSGRYTGSQLRIELTAGSIFQHPFGSIQPPAQAVLSTFPELAFDTFLAQGSLTDNGSFGFPDLGGGAVNIGGSPDAAFTSSINQASFPRGETVIVDQADFLTSRVTLSKDAQGTWSYLASAEGIFGFVESIPIKNGYMTIPLLGDYELSGQIGQRDLDLVLLNWGATVPPIPAGWVGPINTALVGQNALDPVLLNWGAKESDRPWSIAPGQIDPRVAGGQASGVNGDYNGTGLTGQGDLDLVLRNWDQATPPVPNGWVNQQPSGLIGSGNLDGVILNWGNEVASASGATSVPEPSSLAILCICGLGFSITFSRTKARTKD